MRPDGLLAAAEAIRTAAAKIDPVLASLPIAAIGWATVDHERAMAELDSALAAENDAWVALERDAALGASARSRGLGDEGAMLVVLEPDTEGPLAASLARFGEGVAVIYLGDGPVGSGRLLRGGPVWGPHVVVRDSSGPERPA